MDDAWELPQRWPRNSLVVNSGPRIETWKQKDMPAFAIPGPCFTDTASARPGFPAPIFPGIHQQQILAQMHALSAVSKGTQLDKPRFCESLGLSCAPSHGDRSSLPHITNNTIQNFVQIKNTAVDSSRSAGLQVCPKQVVGRACVSGTSAHKSNPAASEAVPPPPPYGHVLFWASWMGSQVFRPREEIVFIRHPRRAPSMTIEGARHEPALSPHKNARPASDVDGPQTAGLAHKRRRLRLDQTTSKLSEPSCTAARHTPATNPIGSFVGRAQRSSKLTPSALIRREIFRYRAWRRIQDEALARTREFQDDELGQGTVNTDRIKGDGDMGQQITEPIQAVFTRASSELPVSFPPTEKETLSQQKRIKVTESAKGGLSVTTIAESLLVEIDSTAESREDNLAFPTIEYESRYDGTDGEENEPSLYLDFASLWPMEDAAENAGLNGEVNNDEVRGGFGLTMF